ncbi:peptide chain release factor N(5)-glutamine methyltransferase [Agromyces archimandritae]|uniref:peptide chain release factor N(5)-glutamine methyltransferase n=1 Tax=Agromyces archimandritae TaxID=2781962 RepID=UPI001FD27206|nr:peptide chain release factor N(5)-glutamine methyltransferase [Agromyces archimandritae]
MNTSREAAGTGVRSALERGAARLAAAGIPDPMVDAELLLGHVLGLGRGAVQAAVVMDRGLGDEDAARFAGLVERRMRREPLQHVTGVAYFRSLALAVGPGVFVPRPETELLAGLAVDHLLGVPGQPVAVDLGSGSGAIALAMASEAPHARVFAVEYSPAAYPWTLRNARAAALPNLRTVFDDLGRALPELDGRVDVVASNPPYVPRAAVPHDPEVRLHDPEAALYGGEDGLDAVRVLAVRAARLVRPGGLVAIEHGEEQSAGVRAVLEGAGWHAVAHHRDLTGRDRVTTALR